MQSKPEAKHDVWGTRGRLPQAGLRGANQIQTKFGWEDYAKEVVHLVNSYVEESMREDTGIVPLPDTSPDELYDEWNNHFPQKPEIENFLWLIKRVIEQSNHIHNPKSNAHQTAIPLPLTSVVSMVIATLNSSQSCFETGPVGSVLERIVTERMCKQFWSDQKSSGMLTSGGSLGNLTALLAAKQVKLWGEDPWKNGNPRDRQLGVMMSSESHYSLRRSVQIMGLGEAGAVLVPVDDQCRMTAQSVTKRYEQAQAQGIDIFAIAVSACSTWPGMYEDIAGIADFCEEKGLWLHVDGAHGASVIMSEEFKHLLSGVERADSIVWDMHKLMLMPTLITGVLFRDGRHRSKAISHKAPYLYEDFEEDRWYDTSDDTMECTKSGMSIQAYITLMTYGTDTFSDHVTTRFQLARDCGKLMSGSDDFTIPFEPESNIICFQYIPSSHKEESHEEINNFQFLIRHHLMQDGEYFISKTVFEHEGVKKVFLRCSFMHPFTDLGFVTGLMNKIRDIGAMYSQT